MNTPIPSALASEALQQDARSAATLNAEQTIKALSALAQASRLAIFRALVVAGPAGLTAGTIAEQLGLGATSLSFHIKELLGAGLVKVTQEGRFMRYRADFSAMQAVLAYLTENCCGQSTETEVVCCSPVSPTTDCAAPSL